MFILKRQDVEISNIRHPQKDQQIPILSYQGQTFTLLNVFGAAQAEEARAFWRDLTDNRGKACVLLEEPERFSVWGKVRLDRLEAGDGAGDGVDTTAQAACLLGAVLLLQAVYFDIEDLLGDRQANKFRNDLQSTCTKLQLAGAASAEAVGNLLECDPFETSLPAWQSPQVIGLLQDLHGLGKVYFGNANFTARAIDSLQDMTDSDRAAFLNWLAGTEAASLWR